MSEPASVDLERSLTGMTLAEVLARNWTLWIRCLDPGCGHEAKPTMAELAVRFRRGLGAPMPAISARLKCAACGGRRLRVLNINGHGFSYMAHEGEAGRAAGFQAWLDEVYRKEGRRRV